jgi:hypothetical protein
MLQILKSYPALEVQRPGADLGSVRGVLRAALLWAAESAVQLAARLENVEAAVSEERVGASAVRAYWPDGGVGVKLVEAGVGAAVAAYFVAGLVGVFVL